MFIKLATLDPKYLEDAKNVLIEATKRAPTEAKLFYNLGLLYARTHEVDTAITILKKTVIMKPNYRDARLALAYLYIDKHMNQEAKGELNYILQKIDPDDTISKTQLEELK